MEFSNRANIRDNNRLSITIKPDLKKKIITAIGNKMDTRIFYKLDFLIFVNNHAENFSSYNFAIILANFFSNLSSTLMSVCFFSVFSISSSYLAVFDSTISLKLLDVTSFDSSITRNPSNIFVFYHRLFLYLIVKLSINIILTNSSYLSFNFIKID